MPAQPVVPRASTKQTKLFHELTRTVLVGYRPRPVDIDVVVIRADDFGASKEYFLGKLVGEVAGFAVMAAVIGGVVFRERRRKKQGPPASARESWSCRCCRSGS